MKIGMINKNLILVAATSLMATVTMAQSSSTTSTQSAAPAQGTSSAQVTPEAKSPLGNFGLSFISQIYASAEAINRLGSDKIGDPSMEGRDALSVDAINLVALSYKLNKETKVGIRQYWNQGFGPKVADGGTSWTVATLNTKAKGVLGSDDLAPMFWYYMPTTFNRDLNNGLPDNEQIKHYGIFRMDLEIPWTITPKWTASYYLNPRQQFVANGERRYSLIDAENPGKGYQAVATAVSTTDFIHYAYLYYNVNDNIQPYVYLGFRHKFATGRGFENFNNQGLPGIGSSFVVNKNISIVAEVNQFVNLGNFKYNANGDKEVSGPAAGTVNGWLDPKDLTYELVLSLSL